MVYFQICNDYDGLCGASRWLWWAVRDLGGLCSGGRVDKSPAVLGGGCGAVGKRSTCLQRKESCRAPHIFCITQLEISVHGLFSDISVAMVGFGGSPFGCGWLDGVSGGHCRICVRLSMVYGYGVCARGELVLVGRRVH